MFGHRRPDRLKRDIQKLENERDVLTDENRKVKDELAELKQKRKMEDEDIRHMVKIKEAKLDIDHQKRLLEVDREKEQAIAQVKDQYRDKMETFLGKQVEDIKQMYGEILGRLPNVQVRLKGDV